MKRFWLILTLILIFSCEDKKDEDNEKQEEEAKVIVFIKTFGGSMADYGHSVQQTVDGGYIITGTTSSFGEGEYDVYLIKTNSDGNEEWNKTFGGSNWDVGNSVKQTSDGGYIITGRTKSFGNGDYDVYLIKTNYG